MGTEMKEEGYNAAYHRAKYLAYYKDTRWYPRFKLTAARINKDERILEIGCGTGQLANLLFDQDKTNYIGYDFSEVGIKQCHNLGLYPMIFKIGNAYDPELYKDYDVLLCCETLEHVKDLDVLENVEKGKKIVLSLPDFPAPNHLFHITSEEQLKQHYNGIIAFNYIEKVDAWYVAEGVKL